MFLPTHASDLNAAAARSGAGPLSFLVQLLRFRRGVPEVVRTLHLAAMSSAEALEEAKTRIGAGSWPARIGALRVMDDRGQTLVDWSVPQVPKPPYVDTLSRAAKQRMEAGIAPDPAPLRITTRTRARLRAEGSKLDSPSLTPAIPGPNYGGEVSRFSVVQRTETHENTGFGAPTKDPTVERGSTTCVKTWVHAREVSDSRRAHLRSFEGWGLAG